MGLPPGLPPDRTAIQRVRRFTTLKQNAAKLDRQLDDLDRSLRRQAGGVFASFFTFLAFGSFSVDVAFQVLLGVFEFNIWWAVTALIPSLIGVYGVVRFSVGMSLTIGERYETAGDLKDHETEMKRLQNAMNAPSAGQSTENGDRPTR